jgi:biotin carboxyl carrier protein
MKYITTINGAEYTVEILDEKHIRLNGQEYEIDFTQVSGQPIYSLLMNGESFEAYVYRDEETWEVLMGGRQYRAQVEDEHQKRLRLAAGSGPAQSGPYHLKAPMPGLVVKVPVEEGQEVHKGDVLLILESMKMQNELKSPRDGVVRRIRVQPGESVEQKQTLLSVE